MADRGRDLKVSILSDADRFDLAQPAEQLQDVADAAKDAGSALDKMGSDVQDSARKLDVLGKDGKAAGDDLDRLAKDAKTTANKVDSSFDAIAKSSRQSLGKGMDDGAKKAKGSLKDVGEEANSTAKETAASFDGTSESVVGAFQEISANALGALGPIGAGIGLAVAFGMGALQAAAEKAKAALSELTGSLIDQGGKLDRANVLDKLKEFAQDGTLINLKKQAQDAKIPVNDFLLAMAGDPAAIERTSAAIKTTKDALLETVDGVGRGRAADIMTVLDPLEKVGDALAPVGENFKAAGEAAGVYADAAAKTSVASLDANAAAAATAEALAAAAAETETAASAVTAYADTLSGFSDPLDAYTGKLSEKEAAERKSAEETAAATADQKDSWEDYAENVTVSIGEYLAELGKQVAAQEDWEKNMTVLSGKVSESTLAELARLGPEGAPLVAELATASDKELAAVDKLYARRSKSAVGKFVDGIESGQRPAGAAGKGVGGAAGAGYTKGIGDYEDNARAAARRVRNAVTGELSTPITVTLGVDSQNFYTDLGRAKRAAQEAMSTSLRPRP